ncbi:MAG: hypothetical protein ACI9LX_002877 [Paraglaciecola sp.]|jgi:hypothetical protein
MSVQMHRVIPALFILSLWAFSNVQAGSVYLGYSQTEQLSVARNRSLNFEPNGNVALISFDLNDNLSLTFDYADLADGVSITNNVSDKLDIKSWGIGASYYWAAWSFSANYSFWQDDLIISLPNAEQTLFTQRSESPSSAISLAYNWDLTAWQLGLMAGIHYGDWRQYQELINRETQAEQSSLNGGNSSFVSVQVLMARIMTVGGQEDLMLGGSLGWNQITSSGSAAIARNGRNVSQIKNRSAANRLSASGVTGTESYGQLNLYASYNLNDDWLVDLDLNFDLGSEDNTQAWSLNIGYLF